MTTRKYVLSSVFVCTLLIPAVGSAGTIPYPNSGMENPATYTFKAVTSGDVNAYFIGNGGAAYTETLGLLVNGVSTGITGLNNHSSTYGESLDLGYAAVGSSLTFVLNVLTTGDIWYSDKSLNSDNATHVYSTDYPGVSGIPVGVYVGFEDLNAAWADFNYTDEQFVFTNVSVAPVPLPGALMVFGAGLTGLAGFSAVRRRKAA